GSVDGDERLAEVAQRRFARGPDALLGHQDTDRPVILQLAEGMDAERVVADAPFRFLRDLYLCDQAARRRIPAREVDSGLFADQTASSVTPDEILGPQRLAAGYVHVDAIAVLGESRHLALAIDRHR